MPREQLRLGVELDAIPAPLPPHALWFGEDQARYVVAASPDQADAIHKAAAMPATTTTAPQARGEE